MAKYGIFMGSFDPVHRGHELFVRDALYRGYAETVVIVPAYHNVFKETTTPFSMRVEMLKLAFAGEIASGKVIIDTLENDLSVETGLDRVPAWMSLVEISKRYGDFDILTTVETFNEMPTWINADKLIHYFYVVFDTNYFHGIYETPISDEIGKMGFSYGLVQRETHPASRALKNLHSTQIRNGSETFRREFLNRQVHRYIKEHGLYVLPKNDSVIITEGKYKGREVFLSRYACGSGIVKSTKIIDGKKRTLILANKRGEGCPDYQGYWCMPCGYMEKNETGAECVAREIYEECGIRLDPDEFELIHVETEPAYCNHGNVTLRYMAEIDDIEGYVYDKPSGEENEVEEVKWIPLEEFALYKWAFNHADILLDMLIDEKESE